MNLYIVTIAIRRYDEAFNFISSFSRQVQVIASCESSANITAYTALKDIYDSRPGNWCCFPTGCQLLYSNYKILD